MFCFGALHIPGPFVGHVWGVCHNIREAEVDRAWAREEAVKEVTNESENKSENESGISLAWRTVFWPEIALWKGLHITLHVCLLWEEQEKDQVPDKAGHPCLPKHQVLSAPASTKLSEPRLLRAEPCCTACMQSCRAAAAALLTAGMWAPPGDGEAVFEMCVWSSLNKWNLFYRKNKATIISLNRMILSKAAERKTSQSFKSLIKMWVGACWSTMKLNMKTLLIFLHVSMDKRNTVCLLVSKLTHL